MDFMNRGFRNGQPNTQNVDHTTSTAPSGVPAANKKGSGKRFSASKLGLYGKLGFLFLLVALIALAYFLLVTFRGVTPESSLVDKTKYQAVFLNGGQVYFGNVSDLNGKFMQVNNVYYLRVNQQVQPDSSAQSSSNDISLVKLGCELHGPQDQMVINREQVIFWENLKDDGQVAKAIKQYKEQFPNGQNCEEQAANQNSNSGSTTPTTPPATPPTAPSTNGRQ